MNQIPRDIHAELPSGPLSWQDLAQFSIIDLCCLYDATRAASDALTGAANQPRCSDYAAQLLDEELERWSERRTDVIIALKARRPSTSPSSDEQHSRSECMADWAFRNGLPSPALHDALEQLDYS